MNHIVIASFSFALLVAVALLVREVQFRRSLQKLLHRLLAFCDSPDVRMCLNAEKDGAISRIL